MICSQQLNSSQPFNVIFYADGGMFWFNPDGGGTNPAEDTGIPGIKGGGCGICGTPG